MGVDMQSRVAELEAEVRRLRARDADRVIAPDAAVATFQAAITMWEQEHFVVAVLDARQRPLDVLVIGMGHVDVHPRDVFRHAIRTNAHAIIIGHNHPSGDLKPSHADIELTQRLVTAGEIVGIRVLDHIIFDETAGRSLAANREMPKPRKGSSCD